MIDLEVLKEIPGEDETINTGVRNTKAYVKLVSNTIEFYITEYLAEQSGEKRFYGYMVDLNDLENSDHTYLNLSANTAVVDALYSPIQVGVDPFFKKDKLDNIPSVKAVLDKHSPY